MNDPSQYLPIKEARAIMAEAFKLDPHFRDGYVANITCVLHDNDKIGSRLSWNKCRIAANLVLDLIFEGKRG